MNTQPDSVNADAQLEELAAAVHGALVFGHILGLAYNVRKGNGVAALVHAFAASFSVRGAWQHSVAARRA